MKYGDKKKRIIELHAQGLGNTEIGREVPCSGALVTAVLRGSRLTRNEPIHRIPGRIDPYGVDVRSYASRLMATGRPALAEAAICLAEAASEIERAHALLTANEDALHD